MLNILICCFDFVSLFVYIYETIDSVHMKTIDLSESVFYPVWRMNFEGQLRKLYHSTAIEHEGDMVKFTAMPFEDFCLLVFEERQDLIDDQQN